RRQRCHAKGGAHPRNLGCGKRELPLHDRSPLLEAVGVDLLQRFDVHELVSDLDVGVAVRREQVQLVALLHVAWRELAESAVRIAEACAECPPLPARDDHFHGLLSREHQQRRTADHRESMPGRPTRRMPGRRGEGARATRSSRCASKAHGCAASECYATLRAAGSWQADSAESGARCVLPVVDAEDVLPVVPSACSITSAAISSPWACSITSLK